MSGTRLPREAGWPLASCAPFPRRPRRNVGASHKGELVDQHEATARPQHPGTLGQAGPLIRPVIERGRADHQIEGAIGTGKVLGRRDGVSEALVTGGGTGDFDHGGRRVDPHQFVRGGIAGGQQAKEVAGAASDIEHAHRRSRRCRRQAGRASRDLVVQPAVTALVISRGTLIERSQITMRRHAPKSGTTGRSDDVRPQDYSVDAWTARLF